MSRLPPDGHGHAGSASTESSESFCPPTASATAADELRARLVRKPNPKSPARLQPIGMMLMSNQAGGVAAASGTEQRSASSSQCSAGGLAGDSRVSAARTTALKPTIPAVRMNVALPTSPSKRSKVTTTNVPSDESLSAAVSAYELRAAGQQPLPAIAKKPAVNSAAVATTDVDPLDAYIAILRSKKEVADFVYLKPKAERSDPRYDPYDMTIVEYAAVDKSDYTTMSQAVSRNRAKNGSEHPFHSISPILQLQGVTHFFKGTAEFVTLDAWLRERDIYSKMMNIPFFARFRAWKSYTAWKKNVRTAKIHMNRRVLAKSLFSLDTTLCGYLLKLQESCAAIGTKRMLKVDESRTYDLERFRQEQNQWYTGPVRADLEQFAQTARNVVEAACRTSIDALDFDKRAASASNAHAAKQGLSPTVPSPTKRLTYTEQAAKRNACRRLQRFVKLADYMIVSTLNKLVVNSVHDLLEVTFRECKDEDVLLPDDDVDMISAGTSALLKMGESMVHAAKKKELEALLGLTTEETVFKPLFRTELQMDANELQFMPPVNRFAELFDELLKGYVETVDSVSLLSNTIDYLQQLQGTTDADSEEKLSVSVIVLDNAYLQALVYHLKGTIYGMFKNAKQFAASVEPFRRMFYENNTADFSWVSDPQSQSESEVDKMLTFVETSMDKYAQQKRDMDQIAVNFNINNILVDSAVLKKTLVPSPERCFAQLTHILPVIAREMNEVLLNSLNNSVKILGSSPPSVEAFVAYLEHLVHGRLCGEILAS